MIAICIVCGIHATYGLESNANISLLQAGGVSEVKSLIRNGADVNVRDKLARTPLYYASDMGRREMVKLLIDNGACVNVRDIDGITPLHEAAKWGHQEVAHTLIENGSDIKQLSYNKIDRLFGQGSQFEGIWSSSYGIAATSNLILLIIQRPRKCVITLC